MMTAAPLVLDHLRDAPVQFNHLQHDIRRISQKPLAQSLK